MASPRLTVVEAATGADRPAGRRAALLIGGCALLAALAGTLGGAERARRPIESKDLARRTIRLAIESGVAEPEVGVALRSLRDELGLRPLDARTRAVYATLLIGVGRTVEQTRLAAFHAARAADLAPVTVPVVRYAAHVQVRAGNTGECQELIRQMFTYDPRAAAELLAEIRPFLSTAEVAETVADTPGAWLAWSSRLRSLGEHETSDTWLGRAHERWPDDLQILENLAVRIWWSPDPSRLVGLFAGREELPQRPRTATLLALRAVANAIAGEHAEARRNAGLARNLDPGSAATAIYCADALERTGDAAAAREHWTRAVFLAEGDGRLELGALVRLARLEDRAGSPASALRAWRAVLDIDGEHTEARRRIDDLTGFTR